MQNIDELLPILKRDHKVWFSHKGFNYTIVETVVYDNESLRSEEHTSELQSQR